MMKPRDTGGSAREPDRNAPFRGDGSFKSKRTDGINLQETLEVKQQHNNTGMQLFFTLHNHQFTTSERADVLEQEAVRNRHHAGCHLCF